THEKLHVSSAVQKFLTFLQFCPLFEAFMFSIFVAFFIQNSGAHIALTCHFIAVISLKNNQQYQVMAGKSIFMVVCEIKKQMNPSKEQK
ncbi:MAG: hypothetical protein U9O49_01285, partial [Candidatus Thermoplasmatota archaeon]|nr:hypothetical protein [Candidatus Thermoplasmatota archaeon]